MKSKIWVASAISVMLAASLAYAAPSTSTDLDDMQMADNGSSMSGGNVGGMSDTSPGGNAMSGTSSMSGTPNGMSGTDNNTGSNDEGSTDAATGDDDY